MREVENVIQRKFEKKKRSSNPGSRSYEVGRRKSGRGDFQYEGGQGGEVHRYKEGKEKGGGKGKSA